MKRWNFTIIELLVVIGIIAILITLLLPALRNAKETSKKIVCQSNLKQMYQGEIQYTSDFNGYITRSVNDYSPRYGSTSSYNDPMSDYYDLWLWLLQPQIYPKRKWYRGSSPTEGKSNGEIFYCPSQPDQTINHNYSTYNTSSYAFNRDIGWLKINKTYPTGRLSYFFFENNTPKTWGRANEVPGQISTIHNGGSNIMYINGSCRWFNAHNPIWLQ